MSLPSRGIVALSLTCVYFVLAAPANADEPEIYESINDLDIGPVFLTPTQRDTLDEQRLRPVAKRSGPIQNSDIKTPGHAAKKAAGYIISSRGSQHTWSGSDFVVTQEPAYTMQNFPGDVPIQRHEPADSADNGDDGEDDN